MVRTKTKPFLKRKKVPKFYFHFGQQKKCPPFSFYIYLAMWKYNCEPLCFQPKPTQHLEPNLTDCMYFSKSWNNEKVLVKWMFFMSIFYFWYFFSLFKPHVLVMSIHVVQDKNNTPRRRQKTSDDFACAQNVNKNGGRTCGVEGYIFTVLQHISLEVVVQLSPVSVGIRSYCTPNIKGNSHTP